MKKTGKTLLEEALRLHADAASSFARLVADVPPDKWSVPFAGNKWTAAEVTEHLMLVYEILLQELSGGPGMKVVTNLWQKTLARSLFLPKILNSAVFPPGAKAPREVSPASTRADQPSAIAIFKELAQTFQQNVQIAYNRAPDTKLTHAYFGSFTLDSAVLLCAQHTVHHTKHLKW
jgi:hypothetical protein